MVPDGVGATVPDGVGVVVPDGVGAVDGVGLCAATPIADIAEANANAVVNLVSLRCIAFLLSVVSCAGSGSTNAAKAHEATRRVRRRRCARSLSTNPSARLCPASIVGAP